MDAIDSVRLMCENLVDKNGNHIDVNELAGVYESVFALKKFFKKHTNYTKDEIKMLANYIDTIEGNDYSFFEVAKVKKELEGPSNADKKYLAAKTTAWLLLICAAAFLVVALYHVLGSDNFIVLVLCFGIVFGGCYICVYPQISAQKKYGKGEFQFLGKFKFVTGLNLPKNVKCTVISLRKRIVIAVNGQEISLSNSKIIDVSIMTNTEIQKQYVSSVGGAIGGAVIGAMLIPPLAVLGAAIGGAANQKNIKTNTKYLVFTYMGIEEPQYVIFDVTNKVSIAKRFSRKFAVLKKNKSVKIDL